MNADQMERLRASISRMRSDLTPATASGYGAPFLPTTPTYPKPAPNTFGQQNESYVYHNFNKWPTMNLGSGK